MTKISAGPGWYADESDETKERYWNGSMWSDQRRPAETGRTPLPSAPVRPVEDQMVTLASRTAEAAESTAASVKAMLVITVVLLIAVAVGIVVVLTN